MEQLIVIAVFAICAAACVKILTSSYFTAKDTRDISNAIIAAENGAECYKASEGDIGKVAEILGGRLGVIDDRAAVIVYFDDNWTIIGGEKEAAYLMYIVDRAQGYGNAKLSSGELFVDRIYDNETTLITFPVAVAIADGGA